jgi:hypothetical protein
VDIALQWSEGIGLAFLVRSEEEGWVYLAAPSVGTR